MSQGKTPEELREMFKVKGASPQDEDKEVGRRMIWVMKWFLCHGKMSMQF
jgi:Skp1 family, dimerisation domain